MLALWGMSYTAQCFKADAVVAEMKPGALNNAADGQSREKCSTRNDWPNLSMSLPPPIAEIEEGETISTQGLANVTGWFKEWLINLAERDQQPVRRSPGKQLEVASTVGRKPT